jgi:hypothetical protein
VEVAVGEQLEQLMAAYYTHQPDYSQACKVNPIYWGAATGPTLWRLFADHG